MTTYINSILFITNYTTYYLEPTHVTCLLHISMTFSNLLFCTILKQNQQIIRHHEHKYYNNFYHKHYNLIIQHINITIITIKINIITITIIIQYIITITL